MHERFRAEVLANRHNRAILDRWDALALPDGWLVAGCLFQTVWNLQAGRAPEADIKDYDLFYFDQDDLSEQAGRHMQAHVDAVLGDLRRYPYEGVLTTNPLTPYLDLFDRKAASYRVRWPWLRTARTANGD